MAFAELRAANVRAVGSSRLQREVDIAQVVSLYADQAHRVSPQLFELDILQSYVEYGWVGDLELAYDMFWAQLRTYYQLVTSNADPMWTAVTGYYAAFFGARCLLIATGLASRTLPKLGPLPAGLYSLETKPSNSLNSVLVVCRQVGSSSHKYLWNQLDQLLHHLETIGGLDVRSRAIIAGLRSVIDSPIPLSAFRNRINYSLDSVAAISPWASQLN